MMKPTWSRKLSLSLGCLSVLALAGTGIAQTFNNSVPITINDNSAATPYPSSIGVAGPIGNIAGITVTLSGFSHTFPADCLFVLVAPNARAYALSGRCGGGNGITNITLGFSPDATGSLTGGPISAGTYRPSVCLNGGPAPAPAPAGPYSTDMTDLFGTNPVGTWSLYVADQAGVDVGQIAGGWSISFDAPLPASGTSSSAFTYQGQLKNGAALAQGDRLIRYRLYDALSGGGQIGPSRIATETLVDGVFTTLLDFGPNSFTGGAARWLELTVGGTVLSPRQPVTAAPRALEAFHALSADIATNSTNTRGITVDSADRVGIAGAPAAGGPFTVTAYSAAATLDQAQNTSVTTPFNGSLFWQSFTAGSNGALVSLRIRNGVGAGWTATMTIYAGEGTGGAVLTSQSVTAAGLNPSFTLSNPVVLAAGSKYTFAFSNPVGAAIRCDAGTNVYAGGVANLSAIFDLWFETYVQGLSPALFVASSGRVGINTTTPSQALTVNGNVLANNVAVPSSIRFKDKVYPLDDALASLLKLSGVRFDWKPEFAAQRGFTHDLGFVAEDVEKVFPEVVMHDAQGQVIGMDYSRLTAVAVQAIKQQQMQIERLKTEAAGVERLRTENAEIKQRLATLEKLIGSQK